MRNGDRVVLDGFGSFKVGLKTKPADSVEKFNVAKNIVGTRINFQPETHWKAGDIGRTRAFLTGIDFKPYEVKKSDNVGKISHKTESNPSGPSVDPDFHPEG